MTSKISRNITRGLVAALTLASLSVAGTVSATAMPTLSDAEIRDLVPTSVPNHFTFRIDIPPVTHTDFLVYLKASAGTIDVPLHTGMTANYGYPSAWSGQELSYTGAAGDVGVMLSELGYTKPTSASSVQIKVIVTEVPRANVYFNGANGHYYEYIPGNRTWNNARVDAQTRVLLGDTGSLVNITDASENNFVKNHVNASNVWLGATRLDTTTSPATNASASNLGLRWRWADGIEAGTSFAQGSSATGGSVTPINNWFSSFAPGQPNNNGDSTAWVENYLATNYRGTLGLWNDVDASGNGQQMSEVVEYAAELAFTGQQSAATRTFNFGGSTGAGTGSSLSNTGWNAVIPAGLGAVALLAGGVMTFVISRSRRRNG